MTLIKFDVKELNTSADLLSWIQNDVQFQDLQRAYLLAFSDEGVLWGKIQGNTLTTAKHLQNPDALSTAPFQQMHIFNREIEIRFWRINGSWQSSVINDDQDKMEEAVYLWGTHIEGKPDENGFSLVADGRQGLRHYYPQSLTNQDFPNENHCLKLKTHQFIQYDDETGQARIAGYRLVDLLPE